MVVYSVYNLSSLLQGYLQGIWNDSSSQVASIMFETDDIVYQRALAIWISGIMMHCRECPFPH